jgi:leucyl-tRNA synthetase
MEYNPKDIEPKWRAWWQENGTYQVKPDNTRPKFYILDMFPYPSGAGLHVGHPLGYIASDILARYKRLRGYNVLHPMGYDSFGLPAEQYAIQTGIHPAQSTDQNIRRYREQLDNIGFSYDWNRELRTSDPAFYKWTQWIFQQLFNHYFDNEAGKALPIAQLEARFGEAGNAAVQAACDEDTPVFSAETWNAMSEKARRELLMKYRLTFPEESYVNWCPALGTVLSNDEVKDGVSERGGYPVERKLMKQWSMRITAYADRLLAGLEAIDWSESIKEQQRYWIGRSQGAAVKFGVAGFPELAIEVFTTRVDTIYGATFMVLAPEHELVSRITTEAQRLEVEGYVRWAATRTEIDRMSETKKISGAFTGAYALHPFTEEKIPVYIADYVLAGYGTGAVMAVPSGDQRDYLFARHFHLPIVPISDAQTGLDEAADPTKEGRYIHSGIINGMTYAEAVPTLIQWLEERRLGKGKVQYKLRNAVFSRQRYWGEPLPVYWKDETPYLIDAKDLPLRLPAVDKYLPTETGEPPLGRAENWRYTPPGSTESYEYELSTMPGWAGSSWYFYRYMDPHNEQEFCSKEALEYWQGVDVYCGGSEHAVGHLLYSRFWNHFLYDLGLAPQKEYAKKLINQGMIQGRSNFVFRAKERFFEQYLWIKILQPFFSAESPIQLANTGHEETFTYDFAFETNDLAIEVTSYKQLEKIERVRQTAAADGKRLLLLFNEELADHINDHAQTAAKIRKALDSREAFIMNQDEPESEVLYVSYELTHKYDPDSFSKLHVDVNMVDGDVLDLGQAAGKPMFHKAAFKMDPAEKRFYCSWEVEKMSKSKYNVVNPDDMVDKYGADCFRMYEMFLGPIEVGKPWDTKGITGVSNFLRKFWAQFFDEQGRFIVRDETPGPDELRVLHQTIKKVTDDIERYSMNTCVSHFMILNNELRSLKCHKRAILEPMVVLMAPFAPHVAEELWRWLGHESSVCSAAWPELNPEYLKSDTVTLAVQINGKLRGTLDAPPGLPNPEVEALVLQQEFVQRNVQGLTIRKIVVVPNRIVNIVAN